MASPSFIQSTPSRANTPTKRMPYYPDRPRMSTSFHDFMYNPYPTAYPMPYGPSYPPRPPVAEYPGYPPYSIPQADMVDGPMDYYGSFNPGYPPPMNPYYPMYYSNSFPSNRSNAYRSQPNPRKHEKFREEFDEIQEKRAAVHEKLKKMNHTKNVNPDSLKDMLYDTLQQEMSALEVLKQQIASFTLLTHTLEEKSQESSDADTRMGRSTTVDTETTLNPPAPSFSDISTPIGKPIHYGPQFDSTQNSMPTAINPNALASMNFINPFPYYPAIPYQYPLSIPDVIHSANYPALMHYNPYAFSAMATMYPQSPQQQIPMGNVPTPTPDTTAQPSFLTMTTNTTTPGLNPIPAKAPYVPLPSENISNYPINLPRPIYNTSVRHMPAAAYANNRMGMGMVSSDDQIHEMAMRTLYEVEDKLRAAEESISEKINEFESELSVQSRLGGLYGGMGGGGNPLPVANYNYETNFDFERSERRRSRSLDNDKMKPSMVKELAVRALQAIDRRLRDAEKTIDRTIHNFDEIDSFGRAVKSATREVGVQTKRMEIIYDSDTDDTHRKNSS